MAKDIKFKKTYLGPYHVVNRHTGKHLGPFTTELDAAMARSMSHPGDGWATGITMDRGQFDEHIRAGGGLEALRAKGLPV